MEYRILCYKRLFLVSNFLRKKHDWLQELSQPLFSKSNPMMVAKAIVKAIVSIAFPVPISHLIWSSIFNVKNFIWRLSQVTFWPRCLISISKLSKFVEKRITISFSTYFMYDTVLTIPGSSYTVWLSPCWKLLIFYATERKEFVIQENEHQLPLSPCWMIWMESFSY